MSEPEKFDYTEFDKLLAPNGPVMIVGRQLMKPPSFDESTEIIFPPSYANPSEKKDDPPVYNIDVFDPSKPNENVCVLDSVPSQANRMEPLFGKPPYDCLIPQYQVRFADDAEPVNIVNVGHRLADAAFRGTTIRGTIVTAFQAYSKGDAAPLARLGATSLVFGVWDSRGTGVKVPRLVNSIIRAFNVSQIKRSAQYSPPIKYEQEGLLPADLSGKPADHGLADVPSTHKIGGVHVHGDIRRDFSLNLALLRTIKGATTDETKRLQRYVLALSLIALTATPESTIRQGCVLVPKSRTEWKQFGADGNGSAWTPPGTIDDFAFAAAKGFGIKPLDNPQLKFDKNLLKASIDSDAKKKADKKAENAGDPIENLKKLVEELDLKGKPENKQFKDNASKKNLALKLTEIESDGSAPEELRSIASRIRGLLTEEAGADVRRNQMLKLFPSSADVQSAASTDDTLKSSEAQ